MVYHHINDEGETYFMVNWKGKINHVEKNKLKNNFITTMLFKEYYNTLTGNPAYKKRNHLDGRVAPINIVSSPNVDEI